MMLLFIPLLGLLSASIFVTQHQSGLLNDVYDSRELFFTKDTSESDFCITGFKIHNSHNQLVLIYKISTNKPKLVKMDKIKQASGYIMPLSDAELDMRARDTSFSEKLRVKLEWNWVFTGLNIDYEDPEKKYLTRDGKREIVFNCTAPKELKLTLEKIADGISVEKQEAGKALTLQETATTLATKESKGFYYLTAMLFIMLACIIINPGDSFNWITSLLDLFNPAESL